MLPARQSDNDKRRLHPAPDRGDLERLAARAVYHGIAKHKAEPLKFGLPIFTGQRGDESLCDSHAGFSPTDMQAISLLMVRGIQAGLIGRTVDQELPTILWTVSDDGWIFEARVTNVGLADYHGYPVRPSESIAEPVYRRFKLWALGHGSASDRQAVANCQALYGFRDD